MVPKEVSEVLQAFPAIVIGDLLPIWGDIPEEFKTGRTPWHELFHVWFYEGLGEDSKFHAKDGIDAEKAWIHINTCISSYEPKHEHKEAGAAYLMSCFFDKVVVKGVTYE
jgi:hypothetical protein